MRRWTLSILLGCWAASCVSGQVRCDKPCPAPGLAGTPAADVAPAAPAVRPTSSAPAVPAGEDPRVAELRALDAELDRAMLRGDREGAAAILADGMVSVGGYDGNVTPREKILERVRPPSSPPRFPISVSDVTVKIAGDDAVVTSRKTRTFEINGHAEPIRYRDTNTYSRRDGRWRLVSSSTVYEDRPYSAKDVAFDLDFDPSAALGSSKASIVVYEFSDYECPFCRRFAAETLSRVEKDYIRTGRVALVFRDNPLDVHPRAAAAAAAGRCAEAAGKRWPMSERLLHDPPALSDEDFRRYAREIGLDGPAFDRCMSDSVTSEKIRRGMDEAYRLGVKGTPMFVIGVRQGRKVRALRMIEGAYPYEVFQATLDGVLRSRGL